MPLQANALLTVAEMRGPLNITGTSEDAMIEDLINRASDECEAYCNRPLKEQDYTKVRFPAQRGVHLRPLATPINIDAPIMLVLDGVVLTVWRKESDGDPALKDVIVGGDVPGVASYFYRAVGWLGRTPQPILATFTGGFDPVPGHLKEAATLTAQAFHHIETGGGAYQSYPASATGGTVVLARADTIPQTAKYILDRYRVVPI